MSQMGEAAALMCPAAVALEGADVTARIARVFEERARDDWWRCQRFAAAFRVKVAERAGE